MDDGASPPIQCPLCGHDNPADAKFCSGCGGQVGILPERMRETLEAASPARSPPPAPRLAEPVSRPSPRTTVVGLVLVLIAALGLYAYTQFSVYFFSVPEAIERALRPSQRGELDSVAPGTAGSGDVARGEPAAAGVIERKGATDDVMPAKLNESVPPASSAQVIPAKVVPDAAAPAAASPSLVDPRGAESRPALPASQEACTEAMTALGLCGAKDASAPPARAQAEDARKAAGGAELPRQQGCTEATAALGLCVVNQPSRRE